MLAMQVLFAGKRKKPGSQERQVVVDEQLLQDLLQPNDLPFLLQCSPHQPHPPLCLKLPRCLSFRLIPGELFFLRFLRPPLPFLLGFSHQLLCLQLFRGESLPLPQLFGHPH